tara:strand:+ start:11 stop:133 length:123 start_codon:yes stop_codon:yes gene_type:complete
MNNKIKGSILIFFSIIAAGISQYVVAILVLALGIKTFLQR